MLNDSACILGSGGTTGVLLSGWLEVISSLAANADEATLFRLAGQLEAAQPWFDCRRPTIPMEASGNGHP